jgi:hypothetical protein
VNESEKKSVIYEVGNWVWGTLKGGFNEQMSVSQIIVDAVIGMIPIVGDVTAVRDLIAVVIALSTDEKKREEKMEWVTLVLLLFALIPVAGGVIKGVGKLLVKAAGGVGKHAEMLRDIIRLLNRIGEGNAVKFIRELDFEKYLPELRGRWHELTQRIDEVLGIVIGKAHWVIPDSMLRRLHELRAGVQMLVEKGEKMIPDALKELNARLKELQKAFYEGEWHALESAGKATTREAEARLVEVIEGGEKKKVWKADNMHCPPNTDEMFERVPGFPNLRKREFLNPKTKKSWAVAAFSGPMKPVHLPAGTKIRRVVTETSAKDGVWWTMELAKDGRHWREDCAVLEHWSEDGYFIELVVPEGGLLVWEGKVASQIANDASKADFGQYLKGGATQLLIDFEFEANSKAAKIVRSEATKRHPTGWSGHMGVNIPNKSATAQKLGEHEIAPKLSEELAPKAALTNSGISLVNKVTEPSQQPQQ